ncbi:hypothetical protein [Paenisporosarcina sp. NPDC076898]|uniref:hypothetical protein n=1 Tax=unclassified Paenisporosarcina TaxID=2642018 RepID=UPI003D07772A
MIGEWAKEQGDKFIMQPVGEFFKNVASGAWNWFVEVLPDVMGYGALLAAGAIVLGSMVGSGGMMKPLAIYAGGLIVAVCILTTV